MKIKNILVSILTLLTILILGGSFALAATQPTPHRNDDGSETYNSEEVKAWNESLINENPNRVDSISISGTGSMYDDQAETFTANVGMNPGGTSSGVKWSVSGPATIDANGRLVATGGAGTAVITATAKDPSVVSRLVRMENGEQNFLYYLTHKTAQHSVYISVNPKGSHKPAQPTTVTGISLNKDKLNFGHERDGSWFPASAQLTANLQPAGISGKTVNWYVNSPGLEVHSTGSNTCVVTPTNFVISEPLITITAECDNQVATCQVILISRNNDDIKILLDRYRETITAGGAFSLNATVESTVSAPSRISWKSSNPGVAKVDNEGNVTGVAPGQATITATAEFDSASGLAVTMATRTKSAECQVTVTAAPAKDIPVTGITLTPDVVTMEKGDQQLIKETVSPQNATDRIVSWGSSDSNVANVDAYGNVVAEGPGQAIITATAHNGVKAQAIVQVKKTELVAAPTKVSLSINNKTLNIGEDIIIAATVEPAGTVQAVEWKSSNPNVAKVDQGRVIAHSAGQATITATTPTGLSDSCTITVNKPAQEVKKVSGVTLDTTTKTLKEGDSFILKETVSPSDATDKAVKWESSNPAAATVSEGKVTAVTKGTAQITVKTDDGSKTAKCTVTVEAVDTNKHISVTGIKLNKTNASIQVGNSFPLDQTITPSDASDKTVKWFSTNDHVAKVSDKGIVVGVGAGEATISVVTEDGQKSAECKVSVKAIAEDTQHQAPSNPGTVQPTPGQPSQDNPGTVDPNPGQPSQPSNPSNPDSDQPTPEQPSQDNPTVEPDPEQQPSQPTNPSNPTQPEQPGDQTEQLSIYRLYNPESGEHLYTSDANEAQVLASQQGWKSEDIGWVSPKSGKPVYRLYNAAINDHLYTTDSHEVEVLTTEAGWTADNNSQPIFYSDGNVEIYRLYNTVSHRHHLTRDLNEYNTLSNTDWQPEGVAINAIG